MTVKLLGVGGYCDQGGPEFHGVYIVNTFEDWKMDEDSHSIHFWLQIDGDHEKYNENTHLFHNLIQTQDDEEFNDILNTLGLKDIKEINEWEEKNDHWTPNFNEQWELQFKKLFDSGVEKSLKSKEHLEAHGFTVYSRTDFEKDTDILFTLVSGVNDQGWDEFVNGELHFTCDCDGECEFDPSEEQKLKWLTEELNFPDFTGDKWEIFLEYIMGLGHFTYESAELVAWKR